MELEGRLIQLRAMKSKLEETLRCQCATLEDCAANQDHEPDAGPLISR